MNKTTIARNLNAAPMGVWTVITTEKIKLSNGYFQDNDESTEEINAHIQKYLDTFLTNAVKKKIVGLTVSVHWPYDGTPIHPYVDSIKVFRLSKAKYVGVVSVQHLSE